MVRGDPLAMLDQGWHPTRGEDSDLEHHGDVAKQDQELKGRARAGVLIGTVSG